MNIYMLLVTLIILASFITAVYLGKYYISIPALIVFITSVFFWSNPEDKTFMYIDIIAVQMGLYFSIYYAYSYMDSKKFRTYISILAAGLIYYLAAILIWNLNPYITEENANFYKTITLMIHSMGTLITNYSNIFMYLSVL
jgi:hypothetical protein